MTSLKFSEKRFGEHALPASAGARSPARKRPRFFCKRSNSPLKKWESTPWNVTSAGRVSRGQETQISFGMARKVSDSPALRDRLLRFKRFSTDC